VSFQPVHLPKVLPIPVDSEGEKSADRLTFTLQAISGRPFALVGNTYLTAILPALESASRRATHRVMVRMENIQLLAELGLTKSSGLPKVV
jgi:hypothetical protein